MKNILDRLLRGFKPDSISIFRNLPSYKMSITTYGLQDIKKEIQHCQRSKLLIMPAFARYKKENKELLAYLLFEANNEAAFIEKVKAEAGFMFSQCLHKVTWQLNICVKF